MIRPSRGVLVVGFVLLAATVASLILTRYRPTPGFIPPVPDDESTIEVTDYSRPRDDDSLLVDDRIEDKKTTFDPGLVDRRPLGSWALNLSEAVLRLDVPFTRPDRDAELLVLHPSYTSAVRANRGTLLPSVNMIDGKAKQFDDGLYAAIDQAFYLGHGEAMKSQLGIIRRISEKVAARSSAADYLAGGLSFGNEPVELSPKAKSLAEGFLKLEVRSRPIGFYTWTKPLSETFRVRRYFSRPIDDPAIAAEIARALKEDKGLRDDYVKSYSFYARMTNPLAGRTPADHVDGPPPARDECVALFPSSTSRETELFLRLFPFGLPAGSNLMRELIAAIRSGKADLKPGKAGGWYDQQVYALETLLLPERGAEANKLLLTKTYKKRMLEAFQALMTKRRETHTMMAPAAEAKSAMPVEELPTVRPRLRVEPNPTYYLRTARSYAFLANFLESTLGESTLKSLRGLREGGERETDLDAELRRMRDLFYGLAWLSAEDIGSTIVLIEGETVDREACEKLASGWLAEIGSDPDLAADTRVAVPVYFDPQTGIVRLWATIGVRLTALDTGYVKAPSIRPLDGSGDWKPVEPDKLQPASYLIAVDEFAEVEVSGGRVYDRAELRAICDRMKTKPKIIEALAK